MTKPLNSTYWTRKINPETKAVTYWARDPSGHQEPTILTSEDLDNFMLEISDLRCNARLCLHADPSALLHDMIVMEWAQRYFPPHRHPATTETITSIAGNLTVTIYHRGEQSKSTYTLRPGMSIIIPKNAYHQITNSNPYSVYREVKLGPFTDQSNQFMPQKGRPA